MFWHAIHVIQHVNSEASIYVDFINCDEYRPAHSCILYLELACKQSGEEERIYDHLHVSFVVTLISLVCWPVSVCVSITACSS